MGAHSCILSWLRLDSGSFCAVLRQLCFLLGTPDFILLQGCPEALEGTGHALTTAGHSLMLDAGTQ